jgi:hypothetical protein
LIGLEEFNQGKFFECHDTLEELWMAEPRPIRRLYQGILQIGVAFYHLQSNRYRAVIYLLRRGSGYLKPFAPNCMGIDIDQLLLEAGRCLTAVNGLGPERMGEFDWSLVPKIRFRT